MSRFRLLAAPAVVGGLVTLGACAHPGGSASAPAPSDTSSASVSTTVPADATAAGSTGAKREPYLPPQLAMLVGLMPLHATGADAFRASDPAHDGRGVLIGILDSGIDPGVPGLKTTTTGEPKLIELRDFSGEGAIPLAQVEPTADGHITVQGITLSGFGRIARLASPPYYYYGPPAYAYEPGYPDDDAVAYCARRFRSYDPTSGTYLGYDGYRHPCP